MDADDDMRTPLLENVSAETYAAALKELASLRTKAVDRPVDIFHPSLLVPEDPVVYADKFFRYVMRFLDGPYNADGNRFTLPKSLQPIRKRDRSRTMSAAGVG
jgi:hypothetical protein